MADNKTHSLSDCSDCKSKSEHDFKLKMAQIDHNIFKDISLLFKTPEGYGDDPIPISLSDYSDSESDDDQNELSCVCLSDIATEKRELFMLPKEYVVGETVEDGICFFDSFLQGLHALGRASITIEEVRTICAEVGNKSPLWLVNSLPSDLTIAEFTKRTLLSDSWGDAELHGRILCQHFNVNLYVLEGHADSGVMCSLVTASKVSCVRAASFGCSDTIYIINRGRNHFEPILRISPEFKDVYSAIEAGDVPCLEAALVNHRRVLYYSQAERQLEQCSLREAILSNNIRIVDLMYEHWAGTAYAAHSPHFHNLQRLGRALVKARESCLPGLNQYQNMVVDVHCIIEFNKFEVQLYQQLNDYPVSKSNDRRQRVLRMIDILTTTVSLYEQYSDKNIRATKNEVVDILRLQPLLNDKSTIYQKFLNYAMYEMYYRKLDFCVSKVILEYVHSLKRKLKLPENTYQNIECALYYFLYRVNEEWRLYMPENREKGRKHAFLFDTDCDFSYIRDDNCRLFSGPVIYFEWLKFRKSLGEFIKVVASTSVVDNFREKGNPPAEEVNTLTLLPYLRDEYSLRKVVQYLDGAERAIQRLSRAEAALVVQRALQVTGEYLKSTPKSLHLSPTTKALLQVYIPASTLKDLHTLRTDFSKGRGAKLIRRIDIEETNPDLFFEAAKDLERIKKSISEVLAVYKPMFEKYLLDEGLHLIMNREKEFPSIFGFYGSAMNEIQEYLTYGHKLYTNLEDKIIKSISESHSVHFTRQFARELGALFKNKEILRSELLKRDIQIISNVQTLLQPVYTLIRNIETQINERTDYSLEWCEIKTILKYIVVNMDLFRNNHYEIKHSHFTAILNRIDCGQPNATGVSEVKTLLSFIEYEVINNWKIALTPIPRDLLYEYEGIKRLKEYMSKKNFITNNETKYLKDKLNSNDIAHPIMKKILSGKEIAAKERKVMYTKIGALDDKCKAIVENLVINSERNECALQCLAHRAKLLRDAIIGEDVAQLVQRYNQDEGFQILTESLLADIYAVYFERNLRDLLDENLRLLAEYPMRNILAHGNPLLEVLGKMLDSNDFPATLFRSALRVVEDAPALAELARLYELGVTPEQAEREWCGPSTPRLHRYFKLLNSARDDNKQLHPGKDAQVSVNTQVVNDQIDNEHIYTINNNILNKIGQDKRKTIKDQQIFIRESSTIYCIQYSEEDVKKVESFLNKLWKKKAESMASELKGEQENLETDANIGVIAKVKTKSKVKENETEETPASIEGIRQNMSNLHITESSTKSEKDSVRPQKRLKLNKNIRNKMIDRSKSLKHSEKSPVSPQRGQKCEMRDQKTSTLCTTVGEVSIIKKCNREDSDIKIPKYFLLTYLEVIKSQD